MPVIAAVDRSERAEPVIRQATVLAGCAAVDLHVVHVGEAGVPRPERGYDADSERIMARQKATQIARRIAEDIDESLAFEPVGLEGDPAEEILDYSRAQDAEYIVVSARKRSPLGQTIFGSVTQSLLLAADIPVVAVPNVAE
jgi:nucleotide-binding universal stress UspA family protein